jgi:hypothetical protein
VWDQWPVHFLRNSVLLRKRISLTARWSPLSLWILITSSRGIWVIASDRSDRKGNDEGGKTSSLIDVEKEETRKRILFLLSPDWLTWRKDIRVDKRSQGWNPIGLIGKGVSSMSVFDYVERFLLHQSP